jgi:hypothetical protein
MRIDYTHLPDVEDDYNIYAIYDPKLQKFAETYNQNIVISDRRNLSKLVNWAYRHIDYPELCPIKPIKNNVYLFHKYTKPHGGSRLIILPEDTDGT